MANLSQPFFSSIPVINQWYKLYMCIEMSGWLQVKICLFESQVNYLKANQIFFLLLGSCESFWTFSLHRW
jgi:hypothetical protein